MVIKCKELLKTAVFALLGVAIIIAIIYFLVPKNSETALYTPGVYTSQVVLDNELLEVEVTVDEYEIKSVALLHTTESLPVFYPLFESTIDTLEEQIVKTQSLDIKLPEEASVTARVILDAVSDSLAKAQAQ